MKMKTQIRSANMHCPNHPYAGVSIRKDGPGLAYGEPKNRERHYNVYHYYYVCDECGNYFAMAYDATDGSTSPHSFWNGVCIECGYQEGSPVTDEGYDNESRKPRPSRLPQPVFQASGRWPQMSFRWVSTGFKSTKSRTQAYGGPDSVYPQVGAYKPNRQTSLYALYRENGYVFVDMDCEGHKRCVYFHDYDLTNKEADLIDLNAYSARTTRSFIPRYGPGMEYDAVVSKSGSGNTSEVTVYSGTQISALFEMNNWVFAQFNSSIGLIRAWFPVDVVTQ